MTRSSCTLCVWYRRKINFCTKKKNFESKAHRMMILAFRYIFSRSRNLMVPFVSSADPKVSSAELMVLLICPSSVVRRRPSSVNFCFKSLLLLQFLFDNSEFFTGETRHIVPPCNKAGISNFCLEFQKLQKFQIS